MSKELLISILPYVVIGGLGIFAISRLTPNINTPDDFGNIINQSTKGVITGIVDGVGESIETIGQEMSPLPQEEVRKIKLGGLCSENLQCEGAYGPFSEIGCCNGICTDKNLVAGVPVCPNSDYTEQVRNQERQRQESILCGGKLCSENETCNNGVCMPKISLNIQRCGDVECPSGWNCTTSDDPSLEPRLQNKPICVDTNTTSIGKICGRYRCPPGWVCINGRCSIR